MVDGSYYAYEGGGFFSSQNSTYANLLGFVADTATSLNFNTTAVKLGGHQILHANNYSSYALPIAGGTLTGQLNINHSASTAILRLYNAGSTE